MESLYCHRSLALTVHQRTSRLKVDRREEKKNFFTTLFFFYRFRIQDFLCFFQVGVVVLPSPSLFQVTCNTVATHGRRFMRGRIKMIKPSRLLTQHLMLLFTLATCLLLLRISVVHQTDASPEHFGCVGHFEDGCASVNHTGCRKQSGMIIAQLLRYD